jgi:hypothetical protein
LVKGIGEGRGTKSTVGIRNFNLRSQVRMRSKTVLNQSLIYRTPPPPLTPVFLFAALQHRRQKNYEYSVVKNIREGHMPLLPSQVTPTASFIALLINRHNNETPM